MAGTSRCLVPYFFVISTLVGSKMVNIALCIAIYELFCNFAAIIK